MTIHQNLIAGEWVGSDAVRNINPSNTGDIVGAYARASREQADQAIAAAKAAFPAWSRSGIQQRHDILKKVSTRSSPARTNSASCCARGGQDAAGGGRRGFARRADIRLLLRRNPASLRREAAFGASRHRCRDHARAGRRRRHHHAVEFPDRDSQPGRSRRRSLTATPSSSSRPISFPARPGRSPTSSCAPACPKACSTSSWAAVRSSATRCSTIRASTPSRSPARSGPARRSPLPASSTCGNSSSKWAARTRSSCSTTRISPSPSTLPSTAPSSRPASAAPPRRGSS
jgi:hypothetical protein